MEKVEEMIKVAITFLQDRGYRNFFVTGSVALIKLGIQLNREPHDIDIILQGDSSGEEDRILFKINEIFINVFLQKEFRFKSTRIIGGVKYVDDLDYIVAEKRKMNRDKDLNDIEIINKFLAEKKDYDERRNER